MHKSDTISEKYKNINYSILYNEVYAWLLFLLIPIVLFGIAIKNFKYKHLRKFIVMFGGLYGLFFVPIPNSDATRYQSYYSSLQGYTFEMYWYDVINIASPESLFPDVYVFTMFYIGQFFSDNPQFFHLITALVYFFVFVKLIGHVFDNDHNILKKESGLFFIGIVFLFGFSGGINAVRFPLGLIVYLLGTINLLTQNKVKYLFLAGLSVFIHFSLYPAVIALTAFYLIPFMRKPNVLVGFALFALITGTFFSSLIFANAEAFGDVAQSKLTDYTGEGYAEERANTVKGWNFYVTIYRFGNYFFAVAALAIMWFKQKNMVTNKITNQLFSFAVLMTAISFIANAIVDLGTNRYVVIVSFLALTYLIYMGTLNEKSKIVRILMYCYAPIILLNVLLGMKVEWETVSIKLLNNPILAFFL
jgi:hypothetical protein